MIENNISEYKRAAVLTCFQNKLLWNNAPMGQFHIEKKQKALYLSQHFILVEIICGNQSEAQLLSFPLKSCQNVSQGNQSFNFNKRKMKLLERLFLFSLVKVNWLISVRDFDRISVAKTATCFWLVGTNNFCQNEMFTQCGNTMYAKSIRVNIVLQLSCTVVILNQAIVYFETRWRF